MKIKQFILFLSFIIFLSGCNEVNKISVDALAESFRLQLKQKEIGKIYDNSSEHIHINISREEFIQRSESILKELKKIDTELNWQGDDTLGNTFKVETFEKNTYFTAYKKLGEGKQKITVFLTWVMEPNGKPKLFGFSAFSHPDLENRFHIETVGRIVKSK